MDSSRSWIFTELGQPTYCPETFPEVPFERPTPPIIFFDEEHIFEEESSSSTTATPRNPSDPKQAGGDLDSIATAALSASEEIPQSLLVIDLERATSKCIRTHAVNDVPAVHSIIKGLQLERIGLAGSAPDLDTLTTARHCGSELSCQLGSNKRDVSLRVGCDQSYEWVDPETLDRSFVVLDNACATHEVFEVLPLSFPAAWVNVGKLPTTLCWKIPWPPPVLWVNLHAGGRYITSLLEECQLVFTIFFGGVCSLAKIQWPYMVLEYLANLHVIHGKIHMHPVQVCVRSYAVMPSAKGLVAETHLHFIGTYRGVVSTAFCTEIVESADAYIFAGSIFKDYSSVGYSFLLKKAKAIIVQPERVGVGNGLSFRCLMMKEYWTEIAKKVKKNTTTYENYKRNFVPEGQALESEPNEPLRVNVLFKYIQKMMTVNSVVMAETDDSWFNCHKLKLPESCGYQFQMQYGLIGWSMGALLGYAQGANHKILSPLTALHPLVAVCYDHDIIMDAAGFGDELVVISLGADCQIIASYHRWPFGQTGTGHFSPIGGYQVRQDMVLILDVARFIPLQFFWEAMNTTNDSTLRGSMLISRKVAESSLLYTVSCRDENWKIMPKFCVEDLPSLLKAGIGACVGLVTSGLSVVSSGQGNFSVFVWDPGDSGLVTSSLSAVSSDQGKFSVFVWDPGDRGLVTYGLRVVSIARVTAIMSGTYARGAATTSSPKMRQTQFRWRAEERHDAFNNDANPQIKLILHRQRLGGKPYFKEWGMLDILGVVDELWVMWA
ncbi:uncharacterized protein [Zea mays]|jgi:hypothetical protein|uniref:uncharacterized protein n=1 Tax=Zea mays TaxID=4577 RepID=UPI0001CAB2BB|nr:uncharacterized protein LOC103642047 [Zea mays]